MGIEFLWNMLLIFKFPSNPGIPILHLYSASPHKTTLSCDRTHVLFTIHLVPVTKGVLRLFFFCFTTRILTRLKLNTANGPPNRTVFWRHPSCDPPPRRERYDDVAPIRRSDPPRGRVCRPLIAPFILTNAPDLAKCKCDIFPEGFWVLWIHFVVVLTIPISSLLFRPLGVPHKILLFCGLNL